MELQSFNNNNQVSIRDANSTGSSNSNFDSENSQEQDINSERGLVLRDFDHGRDLQQPGARINIENSNDVVVGSVNQFNGPITIVTNNQQVLGTDVNTQLNLLRAEENPIADNAEEEQIPLLRKKCFTITIRILIIFLVVSISISLIISLSLNLSDWPTLEMGSLPVLYVKKSEIKDENCNSTKVSRIFFNYNTSEPPGEQFIGEYFLIAGDPAIYKDEKCNVLHLNASYREICFISNYNYNYLKYFQQWFDLSQNLWVTTSDRGITSQTTTLYATCNVEFPYEFTSPGKYLFTRYIGIETQQQSFTICDEPIK